MSAVAPVATNPEQVFNVRTRGGKQTTDPPYPKGTARPPARTPTAPATSAVPVAPAEAPEKDNNVEEVVQEEQDSARQDFHDTNFIPYPRRVRKPQVDDQFGKFIEVIQKLYVNIPLLDAMQVPTYAKYIRDILNKKKPLPTMEIIKLTEECSAAILNTSLIKKKDPGCPTIECSIGNQYFNNALCDLGASVSVMPKVVFDKLKHPTLVPTSMCLQLADQSVRYPSGIAENVPVKIREFLVPVDFVVLDMHPDSRVSLILGRPFQSTANARINVGRGEITFEINGKEEKFAFRPRPELSINANMIDQEKTSSEGPLSLKTEDAPEY